MISHVRALAADIGPRGTGTSGEEAAARYVAGRLTAMGLPVEQQSFRAVASQNAFPLVICLLALLAVVLYPLSGNLLRWLAAILAAATAPLLLQTIRTSNNWLRPLLLKVTSRNVIGRSEPRVEVRERVVLLAHLDTNRCRLVWRAGRLGALEPLTFLTLTVLAALGLLYIFGALLGMRRLATAGPDWIWLVSLAPAAYVVGMVATLWKDDRTGYSCGAHDNAASVAVALTVGSQLATHPLRYTQVWLAFTGAEETDHSGLYALLRRHRNLLSNAAFIGLEGLGSGDLVYLIRQGLCFRYRPDPQLLAVAERCAAQLPDLQARPAQMVGEDETGTLRRTGYRAICIAGRDPATGTLPHWHRADDTADTVSDLFMARAARFVIAMLNELDGLQAVRR